MVNVYGTKADNWGSGPFDVRCLSTDTKPKAGMPNGSTCIEIDTGKKFLYDRAGDEWHEVSSSVIVSATGVEF